MADLHFHAKLFVDMLCQMLGRIHTAMLTTRATETEHQRGKTSLDISVHVMIGKCIDMLQELENLTIILQESDHRFIQARQLLVRLITTWIVSASTVKDITATIARRIFRNTIFKGEAVDSHYKRSLAVILGECCRSILWMSTINIIIRSLISICTCYGSTFDTLELRLFGQSAKHIHHIWIREHLLAHFQKIAKILNGRWNTVEEMLLALEIASETVSSQHL